MDIVRAFVNRRLLCAYGLLVALMLLPVSVDAQTIERVDPDAAVIDGDLEAGWRADADVVSPREQSARELPPSDEPPSARPAALPPANGSSAFDPARQAMPSASPSMDAAAVDPSTTYAQDDLIGAAEGLFGRGAEGLARLIEDVLREQGEPNAYIVGREGGGAFIFGVRYGSGTLFHKVEGQRPVYWTGPSVGLDAGANAGNTFVLVYNLFDSEELYERYPSGEGGAYLVGGFNASYLRKGDVVLIPIRVGAGLRLGINAGYTRFSKKQRWLPF